MTSSNGHRRRKAKPGEIRNYYRYRDLGLTIEDAARAAGDFKKSWGYLRDQERRQAEKQDEEERGPVPSDDLSEAVELIVAERAGDDEATFAIVDRFSALIVPFLTQVAWLLAVERAGNENRNLRVLLEDTPMAAEHDKDPVTPRDILQAIPAALRGRGQWFSLRPAKVERWMRRVAEMFPEVAEIEDEGRRLQESDDPEAAMTGFLAKASKATVARNL